MVDRPLAGIGVAVVIPAYRARSSIVHVVRRALSVADVVIVVDDACPENTGAAVEPSSRVVVLRHDVNRGVGGATKTGMLEALRRGARYIVKIDADDQMDTGYIPYMIDVFERNPDVDLVKGNRFADAATIRTMPLTRLIGNAGLTLLVKFSSGYWTLVDPTNGFLAVRCDAISPPMLERLADRYFFEVDLLSSFGLAKRTIAELDMPAIYKAENSSLSVSRVLFSFPPLLLARFLRRLLVNYAIVEINVGSLCGIIGLPVLVFAIAFGLHEWSLSNRLGVSRPTGTIVLALLLFIIGFQLSLQALLYDVQFSARTLKVRRPTRLAARDALEPLESPSVRA